MKSLKSKLVIAGAKLAGAYNTNNNSSGTGRMAVCSTEKLVATRELAEAVNSRASHDAMIRFLQVHGVITIVIVAGCKREEISEAFRAYGLAKPILIEEEVGLWRPALGWTEAGVETVKALVQILGYSNDMKVIAGVIVDSVWERRLKTPPPMSGFDRVAFMAQLTSKLPKQQ